MYDIYADLHVHIGRSENNKPIKITAAKSLNFANIAKKRNKFSWNYRLCFTICNRRY